MSIGAWDKTTGRWQEERSRQDRSGKRWNFSYWYSPFEVEARKSQRLAFWDDAKVECGVVIFLPEKTVPYPRIVSFIENLTAKSSLRSKYLRPLKFPLQDHYPGFGDFLEEAPIPENHS